MHHAVSFVASQRTVRRQDVRYLRYWLNKRCFTRFQIGYEFLQTRNAFHCKSMPHRIIKKHLSKTRANKKIYVHTIECDKFVQRSQELQRYSHLRLTQLANMLGVHQLRRMLMLTNNCDTINLPNVHDLAAIANGMLVELVLPILIRLVHRDEQLRARSGPRILIC